MAGTGAAKINKEHEPVRSPAVEPRCAPPNILSAYRKEAPGLTESCSAGRRSRELSAPGPAADTRFRDRDGPARARYCACTCPRRTHSSGECRWQSSQEDFTRKSEQTNFTHWSA